MMEMIRDNKMLGMVEKEIAGKDKNKKNTKDGDLDQEDYEMMSEEDEEIKKRIGLRDRISERK